MSEDLSSVASVTVIEVWDKRDGHNISRRIEYPSGKVEWQEPYPPDYRPYYFMKAMGPNWRPASPADKQEPK